MFCFDCIVSWLRIGGAVCPLCRQNVISILHSIQLESVFTELPSTAVLRAANVDTLPKPSLPPYLLREEALRAAGRPTQNSSQSSLSSSDPPSSSSTTSAPSSSTSALSSCSFSESRQRTLSRKEAIEWRRSIYVLNKWAVDPRSTRTVSAALPEVSTSSSSWSSSSSSSSNTASTSQLSIRGTGSHIHHRKHPTHQSWLYVFELKSLVFQP